VGGQAQSNVHKIFREKAFQQQFLEVWERIARRFKDHPAVWAYDLLNEPATPKSKQILGDGEERTAQSASPLGEGLMTWQELATAAAQRIQAIQPHARIIFEPAPWAYPFGFENLEPLPLKNVIFSFHMYLPLEITHQQIPGFPDQPIAYPGKVTDKKGVTKHWDKEALRESMSVVRTFQLKHRVPVYVGEFSCIRWAPGESTRDYLRDCIELFEEYGWDWVYHSFREYHGWSLEHSQDKNDLNRSSTPSAPALLLREAFAKNKPMTDVVP
jgi:aryl-phospho-beta-D-glucosidase BglC (GH1 family)